MALGCGKELQVFWPIYKNKIKNAVNFRGEKGYGKTAGFPASVFHHSPKDKS